VWYAEHLAAEEDSKPRAKRKERPKPAEGGHAARIEEERKGLTQRELF
jgi:hypothetical protein